MPHYFKKCQVCDEIIEQCCDEVAPLEIKWGICEKCAKVKIPSKDAKQNWPNKDYTRACKVCGVQFLGPKRTHMCYLCHSKHVRGVCDDGNVTKIELTDGQKRILGLLYTGMFYINSTTGGYAFQRENAPSDGCTFINSIESKDIEALLECRYLSDFRPMSGCYDLTFSGMAIARELKIGDIGWIIV